MKKVNMLKKLMSFGLAVALFVTSPASVYALDAEGTSVESMADENVEEEKVATPEPISGEEKSDSDIQLEDEGKSVPSEDPTDDELNTDSPRAGIADEDFVKEDEATQDDVEKAEEETACEHSEFRYESNGDGTHKKICKDCDEVVAEKEPCEFDENGKCVLCGYVDPEHKFTLTDENGIVKVTGTKAVLNGATKVVATEITADKNKTELDKMADALDEEVAKESKSVVDFVAYDITLYDDNDKEVKIQGDVNVVFTQLEVEGIADSEKKTEVYHYADNTETVEQMTAKQISDDTVEMVTSHFSTYILVTTGNSGDALVKGSPYVSVEKVNNDSNLKNVKFDKKSNPGNSDRPLKIYVYVNEQLEATYPQNQYFYPTGGNSKFHNRIELKITPNEVNGYSLDRVTGNEICIKYNGQAWDDSDLKGGWENNNGDPRGTMYTAGLKDGNTVRIGLGKWENNNWFTKVNIYLKEETTRNIKVDLFDYKDASDGYNSFWTSGSGINYMSSKNAKEKGLYMDDQKTVPGPSLVFNNTSVDNGNGCDEASAWHGEYSTWKNICDANLTKTRGGEITFSNYGVANLFGPDKAENKNGNRSVDRDDNGDIYKWGYYDVSFPFTKTDDGYWEYDCDKNSVLFNESSNSIVLGKVANEYDNSGWSNQFLPLNSVNTSGGDNFHFGMHFTQYFSVPVGGMNGNDPCIFEFTGDDDVWVFIDGEKVLDIGGIHNSVTGEINFATGISKIYGKDPQSGVISEEHQQNEEPLTKYADGKLHEIQFFYLERGSLHSKCKIKFNFDVPTETKEKTNVSFIKQDTNGQPISGVKFELRDSNNNKVNEATSVTNGTVSTVTFNEVSTGTYYLVETSPAAGYTAPNHRWVVNVVKFEDKFTYDIYAEDDSEDCQLVDGKFVIINKKDSYTKSITVKKTWAGDKAQDRPASVTFDVYGSYTEDGKTVYVTKKGNVTPTSEEDKPAYNQITIQNPNTDTNVWTGTVDGYPVFLDDDTDEVITWRLKEHPVAGYKTKYDEDNIGYSSNINIPSDIKFDPVQNEGNPKYTHIDVELWTAKINGQGGKRLAGIKNYNGVENRVTIVGYRDNSGWHSGEFDDVKMQIDDKTDEFSSRDLTQSFASLSNTSKIIFRIQFVDDPAYKLVVLDNTKTYPANTVLNNPGGNGEENYRRICDFVYETNAYTQTTNGGRYYRYNAPDSVNIGGKNVYALSYASCGGNPSKGIDLVLTPETINEFSEKEYTGNETHPFINTKSSVKLTIEKYAVDGKNQLDPSNGAKYQFEIKKVNGEKLESVSADGVSNDTFTLGGRDKIDLNVSTGTYKITEKAVEYDENSTVPEKDRLTLKKSFNTRVVVNEDSETRKKSDVMSGTEVREYTVEVNDNTTVKFENLLHKEEKTIEATNHKYAMKNPDGTYDLTLEFTAPVVHVSSYDTVVNDVQQSGGKYDVVVVLDTSSSLSSNDLRNAKNAINNMVNSTSGKNVDILWKLVTFNTKAQILNNNAWSNNANNQFTNLVSNVNSTGNGTNYEDAFEKVIDSLPSDRDNDKVKPRKVVIFVTDGAPNQDNHGHNAGSVDPTYYGYDSAKTKASSVKCDYFYALGVGLTDTKYNLANNVSLSSKEILNNIIANIDASTANKHVLNVTQYSEVSGALTEVTQGFLTNYSVANEVNTTTYATEAVITDELTEYVDFAEPDKDKRYTVKVMDGQTQVTNITSDVNNDGKTVTAIFTAPENADLSNCTYSVTFTIKATDDAYDYLLENKSYPVENNKVTKGGDETGTHEGQEGFFSNVSADVVFTFPDKKTTTLIYNKPVIQIKDIFVWQLVKVSASQSDTKLRGAEFLLQSTADKNVKFTGTSDGEGKVTWSDFLPAGTYTLTETKAPEGYVKTNEVWTVVVDRASEVTVTDSGNNKVSVDVDNETALYRGVTKKVATLTITNNVAYTLPETGGRGVYVYTIGGVLLMLGACLLLYKNKKNKNK